MWSTLCTTGFVLVSLTCSASPVLASESLASTDLRVDYSGPVIHQLDVGELPDVDATLPRLAALQDDLDDFDDVDDYGPAEGEWELTLSGTGFSDTDFDANTFGLAASLGYFFNEAFELGVRQSLAVFDSDEDTEFNGSTRAFLDFHFDLDRWRPFVGGSFGYIYGDTVDETWTAGVEGGVKWYVLTKTFIFGMVEYLWFFDDAGEADEAFDDGQFVYTLGIGFNF